MKRLALGISIGTLSLLGLALAQNAPAQIGASTPDAQISFDALKALAGKWTGVVTTDPPNPEIDGPIQVTMRVASRGTLLIHEIAPGGMPEPTMIYVEGDRLTLVHYCEAGNRPRMVARRATDTKTVDFDFADISGSKEPAYVNRCTFKMIDANHHIEDWTFQLPDSNVLHAHFDLKRAAKAEPAAAAK